MKLERVDTSRAANRNGDTGRHGRFDDPVVVFTALWAVAQIGHILRKASPGDPLAWVWLVAAAVLLVRPGAPLRVGALALAQLLYLSVQLPITDNHAYIMGFVDLGLLSAVMFTRGKPFRLPTGYLRFTLLVSYGAAAIAKLNHAFFDPAVSCAVEMFYDASSAVGVQPGQLPWLEPILPYAIALAELLVPLSLLVPRTRRAGVILVVLFHWTMSLSPTATAIDFTLLLFALVFLFLPTGAATEARVRFVAARDRLPTKIRGGLLPRIAVAILPAAALVTGRGGPPGNANWIWLAMVALPLGALLIVLALTASPEEGPGGLGDLGEDTTVSSGPTTTLQRMTFGALVLLQLLNVGAPYLGIKTVGSYIMYSNLQTELGASNHLFLPRLPLDTGIDDFVEIVDSSNRDLLRVRDQGDLISWHEMRRILRRDPAASVSYRRDGELHVLDAARENPELVGGSTLMNTLIAHRAHDPERAICRW